jgi:uncharacterized protein (DUF427 family)
MPNHISVTAATTPVTVSAGLMPLGTTADALELKEGSYPAVLYVPRADIDMTKLEKTARSSMCPWKGRASYYSVRTDAGLLENAVWSYEAPLADMQAIAGHLAFYPDKITLTRR